ncbi:MAG TPA: cation-transporting P-type ATPase, partial [Polyangiaceae bacterium]|nr:cation-transporting P-type ATPase [Polyangiaceae bacterium]
MSHGEELRTGLTASEARERLERYGPNALPVPVRPSFFRRLARQLRSALIYLLLGALGLDLLGWLYAGAQGAPIEALAILAVLVLNAGLGVLQEYRSESALDELERLGTPHVWVIRDGALSRIEATELVPGDRVRVEAGDRIAADGKAEVSESLCTDESLLTGESQSVEKNDGDELMSGTLVVRGRAELVVTRTGAASTMGKLAGALERIEAGKTPLEVRIDVLGARLARYVAALALLFIGLGIAVDGLAHFPTIVMFAVAFGVAVVPESMPMMMTLALAFGVQRMGRRNAVVRRLSAVEALGSITVIASDKTGTLTENRLTVKSLLSDREADALLALTLANDADHEREAGDPLERGLLAYARSRGADVPALRQANARVSSFPFDSRWKFMRVTVVAPGGGLQSYVKGAPETILERSRLEPGERRRWAERAEEQAREGFKVLALATGEGGTESDLEFLGLVTLWDPPRPTALQAVRAAEAAGIRVLMVTGDHPETARSIGAKVGIVGERVLTGGELETLSDQELARALDSVRVFARLLPEHKLRIVDVLQAQGEVVAMTGDGLNDAPALKRADVGVAMGLRGSEVAREVADVVLLDDEFSTIVVAVEEGRMIYENMLNFIRYTFSSNVALMLLVLGGTVGSIVLGLQNEVGAVLVPLTALQVLWINFLGDGPPALALSADRSPGTMQRPPRPRASPLLDRETLAFVLGDGGFKAVAGLALLVVLPAFGAGVAVTATAVFVYESFAKLLSVYPARRLGPRPGPNAWLHGSVAVGLALVLLCVAVPPLRSA